MTRIFTLTVIALLLLLAACGSAKKDITKTYTVEGVKVTLTYPSSWKEHEIDKQGAPELTPPGAYILQGIAFDSVTIVTWPCGRDKPDAKTCLDEWIRMLYVDSHPNVEELAPDRRWIQSRLGKDKAEGAIDLRLFVYDAKSSQLVGCVGMIKPEHEAWVPAIRKVCGSLALPQ